MARSLRSQPGVPAHSPTHATRAAASSAAARARSGYEYKRRDAEHTTLYQVVQGHLETFYRAVEDGFASAPLPRFVKQEFERFLDCGVLCRGAALLCCEACETRTVIALRCKGRGFCPSCLGRRMEQTVANLVEHVIPEDAALRQWVLTFPFELRGRLGFDGELLSELCGVVNEVLLGFYERNLRSESQRRLAALAAAADSEGGPCKLQGGTVTVVQRTSGDLRLNPHLHVVALDGVFAARPAGAPEFVQAPTLSSLDVSEVLATIRARVLSRLISRGVIDTGEEPTLLESEANAREPALTQLSLAAASGLVPAGPEFRQRITLRAVPGQATITGPLCVTDSGFSLHAATVVSRDNPRGKEALLRYVLRPPLGRERLELLDNGLCRIRLKRAFGDGTVAIDLDPISLLSRLAASVPAPGFNTVRYGGVLASASKMRSAVIPQLASDAEVGGAVQEAADGRASGARRSRYRPFAELLKRAFDLDVRCENCNARMHLKSLLMSGKSLERLLTALGEPTEVRGRAPPRGPPYFGSKVVRQKLFGLSPEPGLLD